MPEPRLVMCEVLSPDGTVEAEPLVVIEEWPGLRLELPDGTVWRVPAEAFPAPFPARRAA